MTTLSSTEFITKGIKIEDKDAASGVWVTYDSATNTVVNAPINKSLSYVSDSKDIPMIPSEIFVEVQYTDLIFQLDFLPGTKSKVKSQRDGLLISSISSNLFNVSYKPSQITDTFYFILYSSDNQKFKTIIRPIVISPGVIVPTNIENNPTINTLNNTYTNLTMVFSQKIDSGTVSTFSSESSVSNVQIINDKCIFNYTTPTSHTSDKIVFTNLRAKNTQITNLVQSFFEITDLKMEPVFSGWVTTPGSQYFSYVGVDSLQAIFSKNIQTCTSITATTGTLNTITPISIVGNKVKFEWSSLTSGSVKFTFNGLTATDGSIDANNNDLTTSGTIILYTPAEVIGWKDNVLPIIPNSSCVVSVTFNKLLSNSRLPVITNNQNNTIVVTSIVENTINFTVTTTSNPAQSVYTFNNVAGQDGSIKNGSTLSVGASIENVQVDTNLTNGYITTKKLVNDRTQKVKIILSKSIVGTLSLLTNIKCTFGSVSMFNDYTAIFTIKPLSTTDTSLTIGSPVIYSQDGSQSTISYTFDLIPSQQIINLVESTNKNTPVSVFDVSIPLSLSFEVLKEISFSSLTTISSSSGTVSNMINSSIFGKNYYNFDFTPTIPGLNQSITITNAKDADGFFYTIALSNLRFKYLLPSYITNVLSRSLVLNGPNTANISASNITVYTKATDTQQISSSTVTSYDKTTGVLHFITSATKVQNTIYVSINSPISTDTILISANYIVNWAPTSASSVTTLSVPSPYKLVLGKQVSLRFNFTANENFDANAITSFTASQNTTVVSLNSATITGTTLILSFTAQSISDYIFTFNAYGLTFDFTIFSNEVYVFPTINNTVRDIPLVTVDNNLQITTYFSNNFVQSTTATIVITPENKLPDTYQAQIVDNSVIVVYKVLFDLLHSASITITLGTVQNVYSWSTNDVLTSSNIYSFPSTFSYDGSANNYVGGQIKQGVENTLKLIFSDGDIFSDDKLLQIEYVKYIQDGNITPIPLSDIVCSDNLETITISKIIPSSMNELEIKIKLKSPGPNSLTSSEISSTVFSTSFVQPPTAVQNTPGLELWLDSSDPQGNGAPIATNTYITIWADKSGLGRNAIAQTTTKAKFIRNINNKKGSIAFTGVQRYKSTFTFPSSAYTIFCLFFMSRGAIVTSPILSQLNMEIIGDSYQGQLQTMTTYNSNFNSPANSALYIVGNSWTVGTMAVNQNICKTYINSIPQEEKTGNTVPFESFVIGGQSLQSTQMTGWAEGIIGEVLVYSGVLSDNQRMQIEYALGKKWGVYLYNISPMWNMNLFPLLNHRNATVNYGFGVQMGLPAFWNTTANKPSDIYWLWYENTFDTTLTGVDTNNTNGYVNEGININTPRGFIPYLLNNPQISGEFYNDYKPLTNSEWAIRWGYKKAQRPTHIGVGAQTAVDNKSTFILTGFSNSSFINGIVLLTINGNNYGYGLTPYIITELNVKDSFTHFEYKQTIGPFVTTNGHRIILGQNNSSDIDGLGSVAKSNLLTWLDGSDPLGTGETPLDGTDIQFWVDKTGNKRHGVSSIEKEHIQTYTSPQTANIEGGNCGVVTIHHPLYPPMRPSITVLLKVVDFPYKNYTICMLCNVSAVTPANTPLFRILENGVWLGAENGNFSVRNNLWNSLGNPGSVNKTLTEQNELVPILDKWMFLCMTFSSQNNTIIPYANGTKLKSITNVPNYENKPDGRYVDLFASGDGYGKGKLAEFGIYDRTLTPIEIAILTSNISSKYNLVLSQVGPATSSTPFNVIAVKSTPELGLNTTSNVSLLLSNVSTSAPTAKLYYSYDSDPTTFTTLGNTFSLSGNTIPFTFTPESTNSVYFGTKSIVAGVDSSLILSPPQIVGSYPTGISEVSSSPKYPVKNVLTTFIIKLTGVNGYTPTTKIYYSTTSSSENPTQIGVYSFLENSVSFSFNPSNSGYIYFYFKPINNIGEEQTTFIVTPAIDIFKNVSWGLPNITSIPFVKSVGENNVIYSPTLDYNHQLGKLSSNGHKWTGNITPTPWQTSQGVVLNKVISSDFTFVVSYRNQSISTLMLSHPDAQISDFKFRTEMYFNYNNDPEWGVVRFFNNATRTYSLKAYKEYYNTFPYGTDTLTYFKYQRSGTSVTIFRSQTDSNYVIANSSTCQINDKIICFIGHTNWVSWNYFNTEATIISLVIYPKSITNVTCTQSLVATETSTIQLDFSEVDESTPSAKIYYASTNNSSNPTQIGTTHNFVNNSLTFDFIPTFIGSLYFYVKAVGNTEEQLTFITSSVQTVLMPAWVPSTTDGFSVNIPEPYKLVVGSDIELTFRFITNANFPSTNASQLFTLKINNDDFSLTTAIVNVQMRTVTISYNATNATIKSFEFFTIYNTSYTFTVQALEIYTFPEMNSTSRGGVDSISLGETLTLTSIFTDTLPSCISSSVIIVPEGNLPVSPSPLTTITGNSVIYSLQVMNDLNHSGTVQLIYGSLIRNYNWNSVNFTLTSSNIYTFPNDFSYSGSENNYGTGFHLKQSTDNILSITFIGGDLFHSSDFLTQFSYVKYEQNNQIIPVDDRDISYSNIDKKITITPIVPATTGNLTLKIKLLGPDNKPGIELQKTILSSQIIPAWVPTSAGNITSNIPTVHKLIVGSTVQISFGFNSQVSFPSSVASNLFMLEVNEYQSSLANATVYMVSRIITVPYNAINATTTTFTFFSAYGTNYTFTINPEQIYSFPTMQSTSCNNNFISVGKTLLLTSTFQETLPGGMTSSAIIIPEGKPSVPLVPAVSGAVVTYSLLVQHDVNHSGTVTLIYGSVSKEYNWNSVNFTLTSSNIYSFPSDFTYSGSANNYADGKHLKENVSNSLTLTFIGGEMINSIDISPPQIDYVKYIQNNIELPINSNNISFFLPFSSIIISSLIPTTSGALTFKIKLLGPDGGPSTEIQKTIPSSDFVPVSKLFSPTLNNNTLVSTSMNWSLPNVQMYNVDKSGEYNISERKSGPAELPMYRYTNIVATSQASMSDIIVGVKYLMIIANEAVWQTTAATSTPLSFTAKVGTITHTFGPRNFGYDSTGVGGAYTHNIPTTIIDSIWINGCNVTTSGSIVGPISNPTGLRVWNATTELRALPGGFVGSSFVTHIVFKSTADVQITGINPQIITSGTSGLLKFSRDNGNTTFANQFRFGAFDSYGPGVYANVQEFISGTTEAVEKFGIKMFNQSNLDVEIVKALHLCIDATNAINFLGVPANTRVNRIGLPGGWPQLTNTISLETKYREKMNMHPTQCALLGYPWGNYDDFSNTKDVKMYGYFCDHVNSGTPIVFSRAGYFNSDEPNLLSADSIDVIEFNNKKFLHRKSGYIFGIPTPSVGFVENKPLTFYGSSLTVPGTSTLTQAGVRFAESMNKTKYSMVSWVGSSLSWSEVNPVYTKFNFAWTGFSADDGKKYINMNVMSICGLFWNATEGLTYIKYKGSYTGETVTDEPSPGYISWKYQSLNPFGENYYADYNRRMVVLTLVVDNSIGDITTDAKLDQWIKLYENGVLLERVGIISTCNLSTHNNTAPKKRLGSAIFSKIANFTLNEFTNGLPQPSGTVYAVRFAENKIDVRTTIPYTNNEIIDNAINLSNKWSIIPSIGLYGSQNGNYIKCIFSTQNITGTISRIGFFTTNAKAFNGTNTEDSAYDKLGFGTAGWETEFNTLRDSSTQGKIDLYSSIMHNDVGVSTIGIICGPFVRLNAAFLGTAQQLEQERMIVRLAIGNSYQYYALGFSYKGQNYNTFENSFLESNSNTPGVGRQIAANGIYQFIKLSDIVANNEFATAKIEWNSFLSSKTNYLPESDRCIALLKENAYDSTTVAYSSELLSRLQSVRLESLKVFGDIYDSINAVGNGDASTVDRYIPKWSITEKMNLCYEIKRGTSPITPGTHPYYVNLGKPRVHTSPSTIITDTLSRILMTFSNPQCVRQLIILSPVPGYRSVWPKFEIVASNDGINFVRLPTRWCDNNKNVIETTFNLHWTRLREYNTPFSTIPEFNGIGVEQYIKTGQVAPEPNTLSYFKGSGPNQSPASVRGKIALFNWTIDIENNAAYKYYGLSNVGTDLFYDNNSYIDPNRTWARKPLGFTTWISIHGTLVGGNTGLIENDYERKSNSDWTTKNLLLSGADTAERVFLPQTSTPSGLQPSMYKYWRLRMTSDFIFKNEILKLNSQMNIYFWKLGLYRTTAEATNDTYGLSSNNYIQQYANKIKNNGSFITSTLNDAFCINRIPWDKPYNNTDTIGGYGGVIAMSGNRSVKVSFNSENKEIKFILDVAGEINCIRFPDRMYYDVRESGGTFILEASNDDFVTETVVMVAKSGNKLLGRDGIMPTMSIFDNTYSWPEWKVSTKFLSDGVRELENKIFSVTPEGPYSPPTDISTVTGTITAATSSTITVSLIGFSATNGNIASDFTAHVGTSAPIVGTTVINCDVTAYDATTGVITIICNFYENVGTNTLFVIVRSGTGSGVIKATLSKTVTVEQPHPATTWKKQVYTWDTSGVPMSMLSSITFPGCGSIMYYPPSVMSSHSVLFQEFVNHTFTGDFTLTIKYIYATYTGIQIVYGPNLTVDDIEMQIKKFGYNGWDYDANGVYYYKDLDNSNPVGTLAHDLNTTLRSAYKQQAYGRITVKNFNFASGSSSDGPSYLRLRRRGLDFTAAVSIDNSNYYTHYDPARLVEFRDITGGWSNSDPFTYPYSIPITNNILISYIPMFGGYINLDNYVTLSYGP